MDQLIDQCILEADGFNPKVCFASVSIASKIGDNKVQSTANYSWEAADGKLLKEKYGKMYKIIFSNLIKGFLDFTLLNDFEACGYALLNLKSEDCIPLKPEFPEFNLDLAEFRRRYIFVGPGTGLGVCQALVR
jgi:glucokinase